MASQTETRPERCPNPDFNLIPTLFSFLDRKHTVAGPDHNRWLIPPAALAIHLAIGQVYAFSVFNLPLSQLIGVTESAPADWRLTDIGWIFSIAIVFLGLSAALFGKWLEREGPRKAMFYSALCFSGGFFVSALGVHLHQIWLVYLGYGVLGGIGLGIGYISPVSTLIKWFPDRPGMATGMAIMGFGGGAMIGSPLAVRLLGTFSGPETAGVWETMLVMGSIYFVLMMIGVALVRVPPDGWKPAGYVPVKSSSGMITSNHVDADTALKTPQFWLLWVMLCVNVTAGIGVLSQASPMIQEMFRPSITVADAALFVALLSFFNLIGRFFWSSLSDKIGRQTTYGIYFGLGMLLYALVPSLGRFDTAFLFIAAFAVIMTMYGGGFATIPAYLRDMFGTFQVGAIHGRLLTAWSTAGVLGPVLINYLRQWQIDSGVAPADAYTLTMYIMAALLAIGFACNLALKPVDAKYHLKG
ncbi:MAG: OFA family MFS transporter [Balneolales bacterium]|nr:OFA family MFS transporter [Balneolales bacterium]